MKGEGVENRCRAAVGSALRADRDGWRKVRLEDACLLIADCPHTTAQDEGVGYALVRTPNVGCGRLIYEKMHRVSERVYNERNKRAKPQPGDLIYAREAPAGNVALITAGEEVCLGQRTVLLRPNPEIANSAYLTYLLLSPEQRNQLLSTAIGATVTHVNVPAIRNLGLPLPPLPVQRKIAEILGAYDDLMENNRRRIALLEKMARELYRERFMRRAGKNSCRVSVADVCVKIGSGGTPPRKNESFWNDGTVDWFKTKELFDDWLIESEEKISVDGLNGSSAKIYGANTIVMAIYASPTVGRLGILSKDACTNQAALGLVADENKVSWQWLFFLLQSKREYFNRIAAGAGQQNISADVVKKCDFDLPAKSEIKAFTEAVAPMFDERLSLALQNRNLARQRDRLLPRLLSGKLDVSELVKEGVLP